MNQLQSWIDATLSVRLTLTLGHFLWQGLAVAVAAGVMITVLRRASARARYGVLVVALAVMAACPLLTFCVVSVPATPGPQPVEKLVKGMLLEDVPSSVPSLEIRPDMLHPSQAAVETTSNAPPSDPELSTLSPLAPSERPIDWQRFAPLAAAAYLAGVLVLLSRLMLGLHGGRRLCRRSAPVEDRAILDELDRQIRLLGLHFTPSVAWCGQVAVPVVVGVLRPTILLPLSLATGLAPDQVAAILTHEVAHIRRYDHLVDLAQRLIEAFLFFHPAVWWLSRRIRIEREHCCDDLVVSLGATPIHYSESLLRVAELSQLQPGYEPVPGIVGLYATTRPSRLRQRIARLLGGPVESHVRFGHGWTMTLAIMLATAVSTPVVMMLRAEPPSVQTFDDRTESVTDEQQVASGPTTQLGPFQLVTTLGDSRLRHWNYLHAVTYSPDGTKIATASRDHTVTVWDGATGRACWTATGAGWMNCVAFSPDGKWLATGGEARVKRGSAVKIVRGNSRLFTGESERGGSPVKVWEVETGRELCSLDMRGGGSSALRLFFGPDSRTLVVAGSGEIEIWDVPSANRLRFMQGHTDENTGFAIWALALSPNGLTLATGATDHKIKLWNISTGEELRTIEGHVMPITVLRFSADGKRLFSGSQDDQLKTWNVETGVEIGNLQVGRATFLSLTSDEQQLITADDQGTVRVWEFAAGKENRTIELVRGFSPSYALSPDRRTLAWSQSESLHFLDLESGAVRPVSVPSSSHYWAARFSPDGELLALGNRDGTVDVCKTDTWEKIRTLRGHSKWVSSVAISPDGKTLAAVGDEDGKVAVWDLPSGDQRGEITVHERTFPIAFTADGKWVATGSVKGVVQLWDVVAGIALTLADAGDTIPQNHTRAVRGLAFSANGETLVSCYYDMVKVWDVAGRREIKALQRPLRSHTNETRRGLVRCVAVSPDGKTVAAGDSERIISVWDLQTDGVTLLEGHARDVTALQFTPDGATLISGSEDGTLRLWDVRTRQLAETIQIGPPEGRVEGLALNPSGDQVAVVTGAGTVQILSWPGKLSSEQVQKLKPATPVLWGKASPKGMQLALVLDPRRDVYWLGEVVKARVILRNASQKEIEFTAPRLEVLEKLGFDVALADDQGKQLLWHWGRTHKSQDELTVSGGLGVRLKPGETYQLAEVELLVGGDGNPANVIAKLDVDVGQFCRLACQIATYGYAKDEGEPLESGTIEFRIVDGGLPGSERLLQQNPLGKTDASNSTARPESASEVAAVAFEDKPVSFWIDALKDADAAVRVRAARALGEMGPEAKTAIPHLVAALSDDGFQVALHAQRALAKIGAPGVPILIDALKHENKEVRWWAAAALGEIGPDARAAVPALIDALDDKEDSIRGIGAPLALAGIGAPAIPALMTALKDDNPYVRTGAATALGRIGPEAKAAVPQLIAALKDRSQPEKTVGGSILYPVCFAAVGALGKIAADPETAVPALAELLRDDNAWLRQTVAEALADYGPAAKLAVPALATALEDKEEEVAVRAAVALGGIGPGARPAVAPLIACLERLNGEVNGARRDMVARALADIGPAAVPGLIEALHGPNVELRARVAPPLGTLAARSDAVVPALIKALADENTSVRTAALESLGRAGASARPAVPAVSQALKDRDEEIRADAALALFAIGPAADEAVGALIDALTDRDERVRSAAAWALFGIGAKAQPAVAALRKATEDRDRDVRRVAARAIQRIEADAAGEPVRDRWLERFESGSR